MVVFKAKDPWPQLHVATPSCSCGVLINSITDCENPLNTLSRFSSCLTVGAMNFRRSLEAACELENPFSTAYHFHLSCLEVPDTHACVHAAQHTHRIKRRIYQPLFFFVLTKRGVKQSAVQHLALCPAYAFLYKKRYHQEILLYPHIFIWTFELNYVFS